MSNHYSAANLRFPGDDARLDFTDIYAFQEPGDAGKTILIIDLNPAAYPNGRALTDDVFSVRFAWLTNGKGQLRRPQAAR